MKDEDDDNKIDAGDEGATDAAAASLDSADQGADALRELMQQYYIEYASYCIKDRAIPDVDDGLKPVQRRIMHTLSTIDDGRFHKVAGVMGETMKYHPHGDASIKDALVVLANKEYYIERQGNFGNIVTGDPAAAGRYIECRLSNFAREVLFNPQLTQYVPSYDGRSKEPVQLPSKVPSLLMLGSDGIAVGMATHILPHNFNELLKAQIAILKHEPFQVLPDFQVGGLMDASEYDDGRGKVVVRARIEADGEKKVVIKEIPAYTTTESVISSIKDAAKNGKLKITEIHDLTADSVNIEIELQRGVYADETIQALYAFTECQKNVKSTLLVIKDNVPVEMTVSEVLRRNTEHLQAYLTRELELKLAAEMEQLQMKSLERIFIENRIYKSIEKCTELKKIYAVVRSGLEKFREQLIRDITDEDITHLLQIPIRRISLFDLQKNQDEIDAIQKERAQTELDLSDTVAYTIRFIEMLLEKYGPLYPRRTQITSVETVDRREIARRDIKVYHDKLNYFVGTSVKPSNKNDAPLLCTEFEQLLLIRTDGTCSVIPIADKTYVGQTKYVFIYDKEQLFSIIYHDKKEGTWFAKRFTVGATILNKEYHIIPAGCAIDALYTNAGVCLSLELPVNRRRAYNAVEVKFDDVPMRAREARGFKVTHYPVVSISVTCRGCAANGANANAGGDGDDNAPPPSAEDAQAPATEAGSGAADAAATAAPSEAPAATTAPAAQQPAETQAAVEDAAAAAQPPPPAAAPEPLRPLSPPKQDDLPFFSGV